MHSAEKRLAEIAAIPDEDIDTSEIPEATEAFFKNAKVVLPGDAIVRTETGPEVARRRSGPTKRRARPRS